MNFYKKATAGATPENISKPFTKKDKLSYMCGDLGCNMSFALNSYLMLFWTQYMGLSLAVWGVIILALKLWDAINDPIMGALMDAIKPKPGQSKFKPWIFWGSLVLLFSGAICFIPIPTADLWVKITICVVGYLLWDLSYTIVNVPYGSLNAAITADATERASLSTWRSIGAFIANILLAVVIPMFVYNDEGQVLGQYLIIIGLVCGLFGFLFFQILCRGTTERVFIDYEEQQKKVDINNLSDKDAYNLFMTLLEKCKDNGELNDSLIFLSERNAEEWLDYLSYGPDFDKIAELFKEYVTVLSTDEDYKDLATAINII